MMGRTLRTLLSLAMLQVVWVADPRNEASFGCAGQAPGGSTRCDIGEPEVRIGLLTGASSNHFRSLLSLLQSLEEVRRKDSLLSIRVFDLGLSAAERGTLTDLYPRASLHAIDWARFPTHVADLRVFAWKPVIIHSEIATQQFDIVFWLDAGCVVTDSSAFLRFLASSSHGEGGGHGALLTQSNCKIAVATVTDPPLTHESMLRRLQGEGVADRWQANGGVVGFRARSSAVYTLLQPWVDCALDITCIAPVCFRSALCAFVAFCYLLSVAICLPSGSCYKSVSICSLSLR